MTRRPDEDKIVLLPTPVKADSDRHSDRYIRGNLTLLGAILKLLKEDESDTDLTGRLSSCSDGSE